MTIYTLAPDRAFADVLAAALWQDYAGDPSALAQMRLLLPSRRAIRAMREAFLRVSGGAPLLLPQMQAIGDVEEDALALETAVDMPDIPPAIAPSRRILLLARLVWQFQRNAYGDAFSFGQAVRLAEQLTRFLDEVQREERPLENLSALVTGELAAHWQVTVEFLQIVIRHWPDMLAEAERLDPVARRNRLIDWQAEEWRRNPPQTPVIAAGTTGSMPAVARLLGVVNRLPQGRIILPGLDMAMESADWEKLEECHPQWGMAQLLAGLGVERREVCEFSPEDYLPSSRLALLREAFLPAEQTEYWPGRPLDWQTALQGWTRLDCSGLQQEAAAIALLLRDTLETPGKTAALVTPNRELARRVAAILQRFYVEIDDSAGTPLGKVPGGVFLQLLLDMVEEKASPVSLLALLKHPLTRLGLPADKVRQLARRVEKAALRGVRLEGGLPAIRAVVAGDMQAFIDEIAAFLQPFLHLLGQKEADLGAILQAHLAAAEALATLPEGRTALWDGEDGAALAAFFHEMAESTEVFGEIPVESYRSVFRALLAGRAYRPPYGVHPRLHILSPQESRLQRFDRVVLAGLNEGEWPADAGADPWLSRPLRRDFGLPQPETRTGLAAHDFYGLVAAAEEVFFTRAEKAGGSATAASRWLQRIDALLGVCGGEAAKRAWRLPGDKWRIWAAALDKAETAAPCPAPSPRPPAEARKKRIAATRVEMLLANPYGYYAQQILALRVLDPIDKEPGRKEFGTLVHQALELYVKKGCRADREALLDCGREALKPLLARPAVAALWWPRFEQIAGWVVKTETTQSAPASCEAELPLAMEWDTPLGTFALESRPDRVETLPDGSRRIVDYKTRKPFKNNGELERGLKCQLLLGGAMVLAAGGRLDDLQYWQLKGVEEEDNKLLSSLRKFADKNQPAEDMEAWIGAIVEKTKALLWDYAQADTPFPYCPVLEDAPAYDDYRHLARPQEWGDEL